MTSPTSEHVSLPEEKTGQFPQSLLSETTYSVDTQLTDSEWQVRGKPNVNG